MEKLIEVIKEALEQIKNQYIQNQNNLNFQWVGLRERICLLEEIASKTITDDELLIDIENTRKNILGKTSGSNINESTTSDEQIS